MRLIQSAHINGEFEGFDEDVLFPLDNGAYWLQAEYKYWYHYAYCPEVEVYYDGGAYYLRVAGEEESVAVTRVNDVIESNIAGAFTGWKGTSEYQLTNGQVWRQARHRYEYKYRYRPTVLIYTGSGGLVMDVQGCRAFLRRVR